MAWNYEALSALLANEPKPIMVVDLDIFDANVRRISEIAAKANKRVRVASKSVRVPALLRRIMEVGGPHFQGLMCFSAAEAAFLLTQGFDDLLLAYPTLQPSDVKLCWDALQRGHQLTMMVDSTAHIEALQVQWSQLADSHTSASPRPLPVCIDVDMSYRPFGMHLGVQRSSLRSLDAFATICEAIEAAPHLQLDGVMGYEAQIAGMGDAGPFSAWMNPFKRLLKRLSQTDVARQRSAIEQWLTRHHRALRFFNGGGTGSLLTTTQEPWLTEVTAGSGFLQSHLFDYYHTNGNQPAFCFGLQVTRQPQPGIVTCQSGGFIASGEIGPDKAPIPFLPAGLQTTTREGCGEVQTPLQLPPDLCLSPGETVFFRPAKAGEIAEHFSHYALMQSGLVVDRVPTYRGLGQCFH